MDGRFFVKELVGMDVVTVNGRTIGVLSDVVIDTDDGRIAYILVKSEGNVLTTAHKVDEEGRLVVETQRIRVDGDKIVIN